MSCTKAQGALERVNVIIDTVVDARKEVITVDSAWEILKESEIIYIARGKKISTYVPDDSLKDEIGIDGKLSG